MASEIRTNSITSRAGLSTISLTSTGPIFAGIATFTGSIGIAGTLTYEDVTNIDSVGVITARSGIRVGANGTKRETVHLDAGDSSANYLRFTNTGTGNGTTDGFNVGINADENALLWNFENKDTIFATNNLERIRITSAGKVGINTNNPLGDMLTVCEFNSGTLIYENIALRLQGSSGQNVALQFTDTTGAAAYIAVQGDALRLGTNNAERFRISSDGHLGINTDFTGSQLWRAGRRLEIFGGSGNVTGELHLGANRGDGQQSVGSINFFDNTQDSNHKHVALIEVDKAGSTSNKRGGDLIFYTKNDNVTGPTEKLRITKDGYRTIPNQPYFKANKSAVISGTGVVVWNTVVYNQGSHYDSSNGRFTAPINGLYWFSAKINAYDRCDFWLQKNGTRFERGQYNTDNDQVGWWSNQLTSIVEMTAGQYVEVYVSALDQNTDPGEWLTFMGYLLN